jgi:soluble lytic murein transglycosylase-like protein
MPVAATDELHVAALTPGGQSLTEAELPSVLSVPDIARYRRIFALQDRHLWREADGEIATLGDTLLLGPVLAQRYADRHYRASYGELASWLAHYPDEPEARTFYAFALARRPGGVAPPTRPVAALPPRLSESREAPAASAGRSADLAAEIRTVARSEPRRAELMLEGPAAQQRLDSRNRAALKIDVAAGYLAAGELYKALDISDAAQDETDEATDHWQAGLAAWRSKRLNEARQHFEALAHSGQSSWTTSAGAFWAARVELRAHRAEHAAFWLGIAAEQPRTFYGLLARRLLGVDPYLNFAADPFTEFDARIVLGTEAGRRALALLAVGQRSRAATELRLLAARSDTAIVESIEALADRANLPGLSLQLAGVLADSDGRNHDYALYPVPRWQPHGGFSVDRALLFALMRQESLFLPRVKSNAGAYGLMQLMPATARSMAEQTGESLGDRRRRAAEQEALGDPELNLTLAQKYVEILLADQRIRGNLLIFACAYNSGPSTALHWQSAEPEYGSDPLLFLESIPSPEARIFTKRVLTNYWIYRQRLEQSTPDLDALAAGQWPTYTALDGFPEPDRRHAEN